MGSAQALLCVGLDELVGERAASLPEVDGSGIGEMGAQNDGVRIGHALERLPARHLRQFLVGVPDHGHVGMGRLDGEAVHEVAGKEQALSAPLEKEASMPFGMAGQGDRGKPGEEPVAGLEETDLSLVEARHALRVVKAGAHAGRRPRRILPVHPEAVFGLADVHFGIGEGSGISGEQAPHVVAVHVGEEYLADGLPGHAKLLEKLDRPSIALRAVAGIDEDQILRRLDEEGQEHGRADAVLQNVFKHGLVCADKNLRRNAALFVGDAVDRHVSCPVRAYLAASVAWFQTSGQGHCRTQKNACDFVHASLAFRLNSCRREKHCASTAPSHDGHAAQISISTLENQLSIVSIVNKKFPVCPAGHAGLEGGGSGLPGACGRQSGPLGFEALPDGACAHPGPAALAVENGEDVPVCGDARIEQHLQRAGLAAAGGQVQGIGAVGILQGRIGAVLEQLAHRVALAEEGGVHERRKAAGIGAVGLGAGFDEKADAGGLGLARARGMHGVEQRGEAPEVGGVGVGSPAQEGCHHAGLAKACRLHEHGGFLVVAGIDVGAGGRQRLYGALA